MGFASGSYAAEAIWEQINAYVNDEHLQAVAEIIVTEFENLDSDDWSMDEGSVYAVARPEEAKKYREEQ